MGRFECVEKAEAGIRAFCEIQELCEPVLTLTVGQFAVVDGRDLDGIVIHRKNPELDLTCAIRIWLHSLSLRPPG